MGSWGSRRSVVAAVVGAVAVVLGSLFVGGTLTMDSTIKVEGTGGTTNTDLSFSASTTVDPLIKVALQTPGKVTINGPATLNASIGSGGLATSGAVILG